MFHPKTMSSIQYDKGNAAVPLKPEHTIIAHIVNDQGGWGSGFVLSLSARYPVAAPSYRRWSESHGINPSIPFKLGETLVVPLGPKIELAHLLAQQGYKKSVENPVAVRYTALRSCLSKLADHIKDSYDFKPIVQMPRIGTGLAGGQWSSIEPIIVETLVPVSTVIVVDRA